MIFGKNKIWIRNENSLKSQDGQGTLQKYKAGQSTPELENLHGKTCKHVSFD